MIDIISVAVGAILCFIVMYLIACYLAQKPKQIVIDDPTDDPDYISEVGEKPHCPECQSYNLRLQDTTDGVPWLKGHVKETDFYVCKRCGNVFNNEDWKNAVSHGDYMGRGDD